VYVFAVNGRCRSCPSLKTFLVLFYKYFAPAALPVTPAGFLASISFAKPGQEISQQERF
jgi:hypothetical protein